jgi:excisionase family DNA binding protein
VTATLLLLPISILERREPIAMQIFPDNALFTFKEAMVYLRVSRSTLYRLARSGQLLGHKVGKNWRFYHEDLRSYVGRETPVESHPTTE